MCSEEKGTGPDDEVAGIGAQVPDRWRPATESKEQVPTTLNQALHRFFVGDVGESLRSKD